MKPDNVFGDRRSSAGAKLMEVRNSEIRQRSAFLFQSMILKKILERQEQPSYSFHHRMPEERHLDDQLFYLFETMNQELLYT